MKCISSHQNIASIALRKNVQAKEIISLEEIISHFGTNRITDCVCVINHANLLSKILYK